MSDDLLLEIGVEELPASFVKAGTEALPGLVEKALADLRLSHGDVVAMGTPRRLAVLAQSVADRQTDVDEEVLGPPSRVAFDGDGKPTKAALAFAKKVGCDASELSRMATPKGEYVAARRVEKGAPAVELLPDMLSSVCASIPFRKSMRWSDLDATFGRPVRWLVALYGAADLPVRFAGCVAGRTTHGHRFLSASAIEIHHADAYTQSLRDHHVLVDPAERAKIMIERLRDAARAAGGELIEDEFLVEENSSLVEEPHIVAGSFDEEFLALPERVILDVAKGHQFYFGIRSKGGALLPKYLAVVNTAESPDNVVRGNDRVMRARLADAKFFYDEDSKTPLGDRRAALDGILFHKRLGSVGDKVRRVESLVERLGELLGLDAATVKTARDGAGLAKCDLDSLMVGELPELQGEMGRAYALLQGASPAVADVIREHYLPRGANDDTAPSDAGALVAIADRLDTLVGCCAIQAMPTGTADPLALRRAAIGLLRTLLAKTWDLDTASATGASYALFDGAQTKLDGEGTGTALRDFFRPRLRGILLTDFPSDVVDACLASGHARPVDVWRRCDALGAVDEAARASAGEVFKRAANIAKDAPDGDLRAPEEVATEVHDSEKRLFERLPSLEAAIETASESGDYRVGVEAIARFAPVLARYFDDIFVMVDDEKLRDNRLRLMRDVHRSCSRIANFKLLAKRDSS